MLGTTGAMMCWGWCNINGDGVLLIERMGVGGGCGFCGGSTYNSRVGDGHKNAVREEVLTYAVRK